MDDLMFTNQYIPNSDLNAGYGITEDLRRDAKRPRMVQTLSDAPSASSELLSNDILTTNAINHSESERGCKVMIKEKRSVITIDSGQRLFFGEKQLVQDDVSIYEDYLDADTYAAFQVLWASLIAPETPVLSNSAPAADTVNTDLMDLIIRISALSGYVANINSLNAYTMAAAANNPLHFWRPFFWDHVTGVPKRLIYNEPYPNSYRIILPSIINHVKSIRLLSTEVPNTINNITDRNNLITLYLRYNNSDPVGRPVLLDPNKSLFRFILIKLDVGVYDTASLLKHLESVLNSTVKDVTSPNLGQLFTVTWVPATGAIEIKSNRAEIDFHLKFYSRLRDVTQTIGADTGKTHGIITDYSHDLWYMLGFPWPYEINADTTDKYTQLLTNVVSFGLHDSFKVSHLNNDIFDRTQEPVKYPAISDTTIGTGFLTVSSKYDVVQTKRPYRYPNIEYKYIYLVLKGYRSLEHVHQNNGVIEFTEDDFFAKVLLNVDSGKVAYDSFVSNPLIFPNAIDKIELFDIRWVDERGELVDFGKVEHSFTLEIIHYITQSDVASYNTKLGAIDQKSYPDYLSGSIVVPTKLGQNTENNI